MAGVLGRVVVVCNGHDVHVCRGRYDGGHLGSSQQYVPRDIGQRLGVDREPCDSDPIGSGPLHDLLVGEDPLEVEKIWEQPYRLTRWYGRKGAAMSALGGVDIALWDIRGKAAGKPIYQLLGARHDAVPASMPVAF